jgi:hypothetical protein
MTERISFRSNDWFRTSRGWVAVVRFRDKPIGESEVQHVIANGCRIDCVDYKVLGVEHFAINPPWRDIGILIEGQPVREPLRRPA